MASATFSFLIAAGLLFLAAQITLAIVSFRERSRFLRRPFPGITSHCATCDYPLGHWSDATCPECGTNAVETGVRLHASTPRSFLPMLIGYLLASNVFMIGLLVLITSGRSNVLVWLICCAAWLGLNIQAWRTTVKQLRPTVIVETRPGEWSDPTMACPEPMTEPPSRARRTTDD